MDHGKIVKERNMKNVQHEKSATRVKRNTKRVKKVHHVNSAACTKYTGRAKFRKSAKEEGTIVHKRITGCPLMDHYTHYALVNAGE